ncbi:MAG: hypothetical protein WDM80_00075 [Limisphaerales bacterium]
MGLTIHYKISTRRRLTLAAVRELIAPLHARAVKLGFAEVGELMEAGPDFPGAWHFPREAKTAADVLPPSAGWLFHASPRRGFGRRVAGLVPLRKCFRLAAARLLQNPVCFVPRLGAFSQMPSQRD